MQRPIYRKAALERLSSPEQLDQLLQVTTTRGWLALLMLAVLLALALGWSVLGRIPVQVVSQGILLRGGRIHTVSSSTFGQIGAVRVQPGQLVRSGQPIASIERFGDVISPLSGRIMDVLVDTGSAVESGVPLVTIEATDQPLEVVFYLSQAEAIKLRPGMPVRVSPATVSREQYGVLQGTVRSVAQFASSRQSMLRVLANDQLVEQFVAAGRLLDVRVALQSDAGTTGGYRWSTSSGPPFEITSGTPCEATITLSETRPIDLVRIRRER